jgi:hypothetical protein
MKDKPWSSKWTVKDALGQGGLGPGDRGTLQTQQEALAAIGQMAQRLWS